MRHRPRPSRRIVAGVAVTAVLALVCGIGGLLLGGWSGLERDTVDLRFHVRGAAPTPAGIVIVAIDSRTFSELQRPWPFPRRLHARVIDILRRAGARVIAYDVQFTEPTDVTDDDDLYRAIARAGNVVLATTEVDSAGQANVLGGAANVRAARAIAAAANLPSDPGGVIRRYPYRMLGLPSFAVAAATLAGHPVDPTAFHGDVAPIDFRGPPGTIRTVSYSDVLAGRVDPRMFTGKVVVVGASAPTLQDVHATSTTGPEPMSGAEVQANAIWTAMHDNPLAPAPDWLGVIVIALCALAAPMAALRRRALVSAVFGAAVTGAYLVLAQVAFERGTILPVTYPLVAEAVATIGMLIAQYVGALAERNAFSTQLQSSQLELVERLAQAIDSRDAETGEHTHRIGLLCQRLALAAGWSPRDAQALMHASAAHDIGKIGIRDDILLKPGPLDTAEWAAMKDHTRIGGALLSGSANPLMQMAERIALTHHERWDGSGYPQGLAGDEIPIEGRICAVVDVYDALLSSRVYKEAWLMEDVLAELARGSGTHFDPHLVEVFLKLAPEIDGELQASFHRQRSGVVRRPVSA